MYKPKVTDEEFNSLFALLDKRGANVTISKDLLKRHLEDHVELQQQITKRGA
jgi:hypothetical protein